MEVLVIVGNRFTGNYVVEELQKKNILVFIVLLTIMNFSKNLELINQ